MTYAQEAARIGKEKKDVALHSGDVFLHPFKNDKFKQKVVKGVKTNIVLPNTQPEAEMLSECRKYIEWFRNCDCTSQHHKEYVTECKCRASILDEDIPTGAAAMVQFYTLSANAKDATIADWTRAAKQRKKYSRYKKLGDNRKRQETERMSGQLFILFYTKRVETRRRVSRVVQKQVDCCLQSVLSFYNIPYARFKRIETAVKKLNHSSYVALLHGLKGKGSNNAMKGMIVEKLNEFLAGLEKEGEPHATKVVRTRTGVALRDDDDIIELPSSYSKRNLYARFMLMLGWKVKPDGAGNFGKLRDYEPRPFDEDWVDGEATPVSPCSFESFRRFWLEHYPKLKIREPSYDTCSTCFKYSNSLAALTKNANENQITLKDVLFHQFSNANCSLDGEEGVDNELIELSRNSGRSEHEDGSNSSDASSLPVSEEEDSSVEQQESNSESSHNDSESELDEEDGDGLNFKNEQLSKEMYEHCLMWKTQRDHVRTQKEKAKSDFLEKVLWPCRHDMFVCDYAQNLDMPHFGCEQPGDTYYFSPLTINVFGIVDYSLEELDAYVYTEGEGKKGGNNVVSLIQKSLEKKG